MKNNKSKMQMTWEIASLVFRQITFMLFSKTCGFPCAKILMIWET